MLNSEIKKYLDNIKQTQQDFKEHAERGISNKIKSIINETPNYTPSQEDLYEQITFDFSSDYPKGDTSRSMYYDPMWIHEDNDGNIIEYPPLNNVNSDNIKYWKDRAQESYKHNKILAARYADLVVDFSQKILNTKASVEFYNIVIDSNIFICDNLLTAPYLCRDKIKRSLELAITINSKNKIATLKKSIIRLENNIAEDDSCGLWGFAFKWLILDDKKKINLTAEETNSLVSNLEDTLNRVREDPSLTEHAVSLLAEYYASQQDCDNLIRVLNILESSYKNNKRFNSDASLKADSYNRLQKIYEKYSSISHKIEESRKRLLTEISNLDLDYSDSLSTHSVEYTIKEEQIKKFIDIIFGESNNYPIETVMTNIAFALLPKKKDIDTQLKEISQKHPLSFDMPVNLTSDNNTLIASLDSLEKDYDNRFLYHANQYIELGQIFITIAMDNLFKIFDQDKIINYFTTSLLFNEEEYIRQSISAYFSKDYLKSSAVFISIIEDAVREFIKINGGNVLRVNNLNGYDHISLHKLLEQENFFKNIFVKYSNDILFYFKLVLTEKLGFNLRNDWAHGLNQKKFLHRSPSNKLFHILIILSLVK